jgi:hypothetical protein
LIVSHLEFDFDKSFSYQSWDKGHFVARKDFISDSLPLRFSFVDSVSQTLPSAGGDGNLSISPYDWSNKKMSFYSS